MEKLLPFLEDMSHDSPAAKVHKVFRENINSNINRDGTGTSMAAEWTCFAELLFRRFLNP